MNDPEYVRDIYNQVMQGLRRCGYDQVVDKYDYLGEKYRWTE